MKFEPVKVKTGKVKFKGNIAGVTLVIIGVSKNSNWLFMLLEMTPVSVIISTFTKPAEGIKGVLHRNIVKFVLACL